MFIKTIPLILMTAFLSFNAWALNELGSLEEAQKNHSSIFAPNSVLTYRINGVWGYVFKGEAERDFKDKPAEADSDLFREALFNAKRNLLKHFMKKDDTIGYSILACSTLYQYIEGSVHHVICFADRKNIEKCERLSPANARRSEIEKMLECKRCPTLAESINENPLLKKMKTSFQRMSCQAFLKDDGTLAKSQRIKQG